MTDRPAPPPLVIENIPCPVCEEPTGYDYGRRFFFCNGCEIRWESNGMHAGGDELAGKWAWAEAGAQ